MRAMQAANEKRTKAKVYIFLFLLDLAEKFLTFHFESLEITNSPIDLRFAPLERFYFFYKIASKIFLKMFGLWFLWGREVG